MNFPQSNLDEIPLLEGAQALFGSVLQASGGPIDDRIVEILKGSGVDIARRTVAKYRESLRIPSSVERRREKAAMRL
jgi:hypothetical protein